MLLKRFLIIKNKVVLRRRSSIDGIKDCQDCYSCEYTRAVKNSPDSFYLRHCCLGITDMCYRYGKYKRYYVKKEDNIP